MQYTRMAADGWRTNKRSDEQPYTLVLLGNCDYHQHSHSHPVTLHTQHSPSDLLARGEVEEDGAFHDVELAVSCAADTGEGIFRALKLHEGLAEAGHHGYITR